MIKQPRPKQQQSGRDGKQSQHAKHDEESRSADPYPWLDGKDPRRHMTDERNIVEIHRPQGFSLG